MILFETDKKPLTFLLDQIDQRELSLPDFQRSFVWDPNATRELVVSVVQSFPAGTLLFMRGGAHVFAPRAVEESPELKEKTPSYLVLDGQQRLTSLYQAFRGRGTHRFFLNLKELIDGEDVDEATEVYPFKRARRWNTLDGQAADLMLPLAHVFKFADWRDDVLELRAETGDERKKLRAQLNELEAQFVKPVEGYVFPVTTLAEDTPVEAVCTIFETLNRTGVKLSAFELLTARAFADEIRLRDMWSLALHERPILNDFSVDPYYVLQAICVRAHGSAKRSAVLNLNVAEIVEEWDAVVSGMAEGIRLLRDECGVLVERWLPYKTMLVTLGATWPTVAAAKGPKLGERRAKMRRWFWCSAFSGSYDNASNSTAESDSVSLRTWLEEGEAPPVVADFSFDTEQLREVTPRQRALYQTTMALLMRGTPQDFHDGSPLTPAVIEGRSVDDHHVFPRAWLTSAHLANRPDTILNHTLIGKLTNIMIGARAPSKYLSEMGEALKDELGPILESHLLPPEPDGPLRTDDYDAFLDWRLARVSAELQLATGSTPLATTVAEALPLDAEEEPPPTTTVGEALPLNAEEEPDAEAGTVDRAYWITRRGSAPFRVVDAIFEIVREADPTLSLHYTKRYVGLARNGTKDNMIIFLLQKQQLLGGFKIQRDEELESRIEAAGFDIVGYNPKRGRYRIRLSDEVVANEREIIQELVTRALNRG